jgi:hypothetical protein
MIQYVPRIFRLDCKPDLLSDNNTISSAYNKQFTERSPILTGSQLPVTKSLTISSIKIKKEWLKTFPCLTPHSGKCRKIESFNF